MCLLEVFLCCFSSCLSSNLFVLSVFVGSLFVLLACNWRGRENPPRAVFTSSVFYRVCNCIYFGANRKRHRQPAPLQLESQFLVTTRLWSLKHPSTASTFPAKNTFFLLNPNVMLFLCLMKSLASRRLWKFNVLVVNILTSKVQNLKWILWLCKRSDWSQVEIFKVQFQKVVSWSFILWTGGRKAMSGWKAAILHSCHSDAANPRLLSPPDILLLPHKKASNATNTSTSKETPAQTFSIPNQNFQL